MYFSLIGLNTFSFIKKNRRLWMYLHSKSDSITLKEMKKKQLEKGGNWYEGKFEFSTDEPVKLSKAEKKPEE